jgi:hypothetical protein
MNKYVIGRATFDAHGFRDGTLYLESFRDKTWSSELIDALIFNDDTQANITLTHYKDTGALPFDTEVWMVDAKRLFKTKLKGK